MTTEQLALLTAFKERMRFQGLAESTQKTYHDHVYMFMNKFPGRMPNGISFEEIKNYLLKIQNGKYRDQAKFSILKFYNEIVGELRPLTSLPNAKRPYKLPKVISPQDCMKIFSAIDNLKHRCIIQLAYACGLRVSELTRIRLMHLDSRERTLFVEQSKGAKDRSVPVPDETWVLIGNYFGKYFERSKARKTDFLFKGEKEGAPYSVRSIQEILTGAVRMAGILKHVTVHTLRHSRATHLLKGGVDIHALKELLGHWQIKTTEIYLHINTTDLRQMVTDADKKILQLYPQPQLLKAV